MRSRTLRNILFFLFVFIFTIISIVVLSYLTRQSAVKRYNVQSTAQQVTVREESGKLRAVIPDEKKFPIQSLAGFGFICALVGGYLHLMRKRKSKQTDGRNSKTDKRYIFTHDQTYPTSNVRFLSKNQQNRKGL